MQGQGDRVTPCKPASPPNPVLCHAALVSLIGMAGWDL